MAENEFEVNITSCNCPQLGELYAQLRELYQLRGEIDTFKIQFERDPAKKSYEEFRECQDKSSKLKEIEQKFDYGLESLVVGGDLKVNDKEKEVDLSCARCGNYVYTVPKEDYRKEKTNDNN